MKQITFKLVAYSAAAGKYDPQSPNLGNEDNFYVDDNLSDTIMSNFTPDNLVQMSECGMLMVVADGMGGMNAGEVASEIAIKTVSEFFSPGKITPQMAQSKQERRSYLERVIVAADNNIKQDARTNPEHSGMGSTIIIAWLVGDELTVSWCGDSRCYRFNPKTGIELLSHDHSYVQELADKGVITYEQTFGHPQGNIVTRSLGDEGGTAHPETRDFKVYQDDIIMLCSDGLSGVVFDRQFYLDNILLSNDNLEDVIRANQHSMIACREALFAAAEKAEWYDNVTVILCQICGGADSMTVNNPTSDAKSSEQPSEESPIEDTLNAEHDVLSKGKKRKIMVLIVSILILLAIGGGFLMWKKKPVREQKTNQMDSKQEKEAIIPDSLQVDIIKMETSTSPTEEFQSKKAGVRKKSSEARNQTTTGVVDTSKNLWEYLEKVSDATTDKSHGEYSSEQYEERQHVVKEGETILKIARGNGIIQKNATIIPKNKLDRILDCNKKPFADPNKVKIKAGDTLYLKVKVIK